MTPLFAQIHQQSMNGLDGIFHAFLSLIAAFFYFGYVCGRIHNTSTNKGMFLDVQSFSCSHKDTQIYR